MLFLFALPLIILCIYIWVTFLAVAVCTVYDLLVGANTLSTFSKYLSKLFK